MNLTPHVVNVGLRKFEPSGIVARLAETNEEVGKIDGISIIKQVRGEIMGLEPPLENVYYIVSRVIFDASDRKDLLAVGETIRDKEGKIIGCKNLVIKS